MLLQHPWKRRTISDEKHRNSSIKAITENTEFETSDKRRFQVQKAFSNMATWVPPDSSVYREYVTLAALVLCGCHSSIQIAKFFYALFLKYQFVIWLSLRLRHFFGQAKPSMGILPHKYKVFIIIKKFTQGNNFCDHLFQFYLDSAKHSSARISTWWKMTVSLFRCPKNQQRDGKYLT